MVLVQKNELLPKNPAGASTSLRGRWSDRDHLTTDQDNSSENGDKMPWRRKESIGKPRSVSQCRSESRYSRCSSRALTYAKKKISTLTTYPGASTLLLSVSGQFTNQPNLCEDELGVFLGPLFSATLCDDVDDSLLSESSSTHR
jgi:hypothetical protein